MTIAENMKEINDGGFHSQAFRQSGNMSLIVEEDFNNDTISYTFEDGSKITFKNFTCEVA